jgi:ATP-dependent DNA helicase RecQ
MQNKYDRAKNLLSEMLGLDSEFRVGQWEAIDQLVNHHQRVLLVQKTGWGKSIVYFIATRMMRDQGAGPTLLISPLLSLMRDQIKMAEKIGIRALTINSTNRDEWSAIEISLLHDECDVMLISPERLNNQQFLQEVLPKISGRIGMFVIDEAHCISDWGHDFRPDYMRIVRILEKLPPIIPVLGTTATANDRVIADIKKQMGNSMLLLRGPLAREGLRLQNIRLGSLSERLAWLLENLPKFGDKQGLIYCQTIRDTERVAQWLSINQINAKAYHSNLEDDEREYLENAFKKNEINILVATVALGMGFDKPDVFFVIHFQCPGSVVHYYQQVGRAGRQLKRSYGILLGGDEDEAIQEYFINSAFPSNRVMISILDCLEKTEGLSKNEILSQVNLSFSMLEKALKLLELDQAIGVDSSGKTTYFRTSKRWQPDIARMERITNLRRAEVAEMQAYLNCQNCLMEFLQQTLNDPHPHQCGICSNCTGRGFSSFVNNYNVSQAIIFLKGEQIEILPRKMWPWGLFTDGRSTRIPNSCQNEVGRALAYYGDGLWGGLVKKGKYQDGFFSDELITAAANLIQYDWKPFPSPKWVVSIPSSRHPELVPAFAQALAIKLDMPYYEVFERVSNPPEQKKMDNSLFQSKNVLSSLRIKGRILPEPVLIVDDIVDSRWSITIAGYLLKENGSGPVFPFTLGQAAGRKK